MHLSSSREQRSLLVGVLVSALMGLGLASGCAPKIAVEAPASVESLEQRAAPEFSAVDHRGERVALAEAGDARLTVLVFYRGAW